MWAGRAVGVLPGVDILTGLWLAGWGKKAEASRLRKWGCERTQGAWGSM